MCVCYLHSVRDCAPVWLICHLSCLVPCPVLSSHCLGPYHPSSFCGHVPAAAVASFWFVPGVSFGDSALGRGDTGGFPGQYRAVLLPRCPKESSTQSHGWDRAVRWVLGGSWWIRTKPCMSA